MNDAFLSGNGFDTYEEQDRVLMGLSGSVLALSGADAPALPKGEPIT